MSMNGSSGADILVGNNQSNHLNGGAGNDLLTGNGSNDEWSARWRNACQRCGAEHQC